MKSRMPSVNLYFTFYADNNFYSRRLKYGSFSTTVCRKPQNFCSVPSNAVVRPLEIGSMPSGLFSLKPMSERSKSESLRDLSITNGFPKTD